MWSQALGGYITMVRLVYHVYHNAVTGWITIQHGFSRCESSIGDRILAINLADIWATRRAIRWLIIDYMKHKVKFSLSSIYECDFCWSAWFMFCAKNNYPTYSECMWDSCTVLANVWRCGRRLWTTHDIHEHKATTVGYVDLQWSHRVAKSRSIMNSFFICTAFVTKKYLHYMVYFGKRKWSISATFCVRRDEKMENGVGKRSK